MATNSTPAVSAAADVAPAVKASRFSVVPTQVSSVASSEASAPAAEPNSPAEAVKETAEPSKEASSATDEAKPLPSAEALERPQKSEKPRTRRMSAPTSATFDMTDGDPPSRPPSRSVLKTSISFVKMTKDKSEGEIEAKVRFDTTPVKVAEVPAEVPEVAEPAAEATATEGAKEAAAAAKVEATPEKKEEAKEEGSSKETTPEKVEETKEEEKREEPDDYPSSDEDDQDATDSSPDGRFLKFSEEIGRGSFKTVYRGLDTESGVSVAWCELQVS